MNRYRLRRIRLVAVLAATFLVANSIGILEVADAAVLTNTYVRTNRIKAAQTTSFRLVFRTVGAGSTTASVNFNGGDGASGWTSQSGVVNASQTISSASCATETGATALPGSLAASGATGTVSITGITALAATTSYCVDLTSTTALTMPVAGEYHPVVTVGSDSTIIALRTIAADQISVTATVPPAFNFVLGGTSDPLGAISTGAVKVSTGVTVTVNTNAKNGWFAYASGSGGLTSPSSGGTVASTTPGSGATLSAGTEGYVLGLPAAGINQGTGTGIGTTSATGGYASNGTTTGSGLDSTIRQIASSTGTAQNAVITLKQLAAISSLTKPGTDYADTVTVIGAGYF